MRSRKTNLSRDGLLAIAVATLAATVLLGLATAAGAAIGTETARGTTRLLYAPGEIVPIPASIPHEEGDMVDRRIVRDLRWLAQRYPIYVTDGYSGPLPDGSHAGCRGCHVKNSDHYNGLAVDIVPIDGTARCDARWRGITRLARWAEPRNNRPIPPFRWVGYNGDSGHGCGHHLHLSWNHAGVRQFELAEWVEVLPRELTAEVAGKPRRKKRKPQQPSGPTGGQTGSATSGGSSGPTGGLALAHTGGVAPRGSGD